MRAGSWLSQICVITILTMSLALPFYPQKALADGDTDAGVSDASVMAEAAVWAPLSRFIGKDPSCGEDLAAAKLFIMDHTRIINGVLPEGSSQDKISGWAQAFYNAPLHEKNVGESYLHLKHFITQTCREALPKYAELNESAQKAVDLYHQMTIDDGNPVPFTPYPLLDAMLMMGGVVGMSALAGRMLKRTGIFYRF
ncbi:MAG: hypothetical protein QXW91_00905 [Candidatus Nitrosotenuis sp.]